MTDFHDLTFPGQECWTKFDVLVYLFVLIDLICDCSKEIFGKFNKEALEQAAPEKHYKIFLLFRKEILLHGFE